MFHDNVILPLLENLTLRKKHHAFCIDETFFSYETLYDHVCAIRQAVRNALPQQQIVALVANDDIFTYAAIIALWMEGKAYVPLLPSQPIERNLEILEQTGVDLLLYSTKDVFQAVNSINISLAHPADAADPVRTSDDDLAYILFTSGSTGKPKGVPISRQNIAAFIDSFWKTGIKLDENDRCLQGFELTFDVSVQSFLTPLLRGACVFTIPQNQIKYSYVYGLMDDHKLTFGAMPPSMLRFLKPYFSEIDAPDFKTCILTAEASDISLVREWAAHVPNAEIYNFYGPTEATIYCTFYKFANDNNPKHLNGLMAIGRPMDGVSTIIIDENGKLCEVNQPGELCVSGDQLTSGYWQNPEKNSESFFHTEINGNTHRFYRTGDSCFVDIDGDIIYGGRIDYQVKIQGYRVELGEIEYHARNFLQSKNAVASTFENTYGNTEVLLFIEGAFDQKDELMQYMKSKVPSYMVPSRYVAIDKFPLNASDKVDRIKLKEKISGNII